MQTRPTILEDNLCTKFKLTVAVNEARIKLAKHADQELRDALTVFLAIVARRPEFKDITHTFRGSINIKSISDWTSRDHVFSMKTENKKQSFTFSKHDIFGGK